MAEISLKKAALITAASKYINIFTGIVFSAILSRILSPNDYGIVAIVTVFTTFFLVISNCGLGIAVVQRKDFEQKHFNSLFTFSVYFGVFLALTFCALAYPISILYKNKVYIYICLLLSISIFFNTINAVPDGMLKREKRFLLIGVRLIIVSFITYGTTIFLALLNFKYYALVIQSIVSSILIFLWNLRNAKVKLVLKIDWKTIKSIIGYSGFDFLFNLVNYFSRNLDKMIIGKKLGNEQLAQYNKAYHFMLYPVQNLTNIITPSLHPILSEYQNDVHYIYEKYMKVLKLLSLMGVFVTPFCFACAEEIIIILYGNQWYSAVDCFKYMSLAIWCQMIGGTTGALYAALNDTRRQFFTSVINTGIIILAFILGAATKNIVTISLYASIALNIHFFVSFGTLISLTMKENFFKFIAKLMPDLLIMGFLFGCTKLVNLIVLPNIVLSLFVKGVTFGIIYMILLIIGKQWKYYIPLLPSKLRKKI